MSARFEELDFQPTSMGDLTRRRRVEPTLGVDVFEVKLGEEFLMSSLFTVAEEELANLGLAAVEGTDLDVLVGGLGFAATRLAPVTSSAANALSAEAARKAAAAAPQAVEETAADVRLKALTEEQRVKLLEADKAREAREAAKKRDRPPPPSRRSGPQPKSGTPFVNGGNKYDPLNGSL